MLRNDTFLRWEANLRVSTILGLVGGGGLGQAIYHNIGVPLLRSLCACTRSRDESPVGRSPHTGRSPEHSVCRVARAQSVGRSGPVRTMCPGIAS